MTFNLMHDAGRIQITDHAWANVPLDVQTKIVADSLTILTQAAQTAVINGGFAREDAILLRLPMTLDPEGFAQLSAAAEDFLHTAAKIEDAAGKRLKTSSDSKSAIHSTIAVMHFTNNDNNQQPTPPPATDT